MPFRIAKTGRFSRVTVQGGPVGYSEIFTAMGADKPLFRPGRGDEVTVPVLAGKVDTGPSVPLTHVR